MSLKSLSFRKILILLALIVAGTAATLTGSHNPDGGTISDPPPYSFGWTFHGHGTHGGHSGGHTSAGYVIAPENDQVACPAGSTCQEWSFISNNGPVGTGTFCCLGSNGQCIN